MLPSNFLLLLEGKHKAGLSRQTMLSLVLWGSFILALNLQEYGIIFMDKASREQMARLQIYFKFLYCK